MGKAKNSCVAKTKNIPGAKLLVKESVTKDTTSKSSSNDTNPPSTNLAKAISLVNSMNKLIVGTTGIKPDITAARQGQPSPPKFPRQGQPSPPKGPLDAKQPSPKATPNLYDGIKRANKRSAETGAISGPVLPKSYNPVKP